MSDPLSDFPQCPWFGDLLKPPIVVLATPQLAQRLAEERAKTCRSEEDLLWAQQFARRLMGEFQIPDEHELSLMAHILSTRRGQITIQPFSLSSRSSNVFKHALAEWQNLGPELRLTIATVGSTKPTRGPPAYSQEKVELFESQFEKMLSAASRRVEIERPKKKRGRPKALGRHDAVSIFAHFWERFLEREFIPEFDDDPEDSTDPDLKVRHPQNSASKFCCEMFWALCDQNVAPNGIEYLMDELKRKIFPFMANQARLSMLKRNLERAQSRPRHTIDSSP